MAPLSGLERHPLAPTWHRVGNLIFRYGEHFYNFSGLRRYKAKFLPDWQPRYLASPGGRALPRVLIDVSTLISGGVRGLLGRGS
jgi:phosphatidylglycerol lysyltransferase